jgi:hypothetical protein
MGHLIPAGTGFQINRDVDIRRLGDSLGNEPAPAPEPEPEQAAS